MDEAGVTDTGARQHGSVRRARVRGLAAGLVFVGVLMLISEVVIRSTQSARLPVLIVVFIAGSSLRAVAQHRRRRRADRTGTAAYGVDTLSTP